MAIDVTVTFEKLAQDLTAVRDRELQFAVSQARKAEWIVNGLRVQLEGILEKANAALRPSDIGLRIGGSSFGNALHTGSRCEVQLVRLNADAFLPIAVLQIILDKDGRIEVAFANGNSTEHLPDVAEDDALVELIERFCRTALDLSD